MKSNTTLGHSTNTQPIGQMPDIASDSKTSLVANTGKQILSILETEDQDIVANNQMRFNQLLNELDIEIKRISKEVDYDYNSRDYEYRLILNSDKLDELFDNLLLKYPNLELLFSEYISLVDDIEIQKLLRKKFINEVCIDLLYEIGETCEDVNMYYYDELRKGRTELNWYSNIANRCKMLGVNHIYLADSIASYVSKTLNDKTFREFISTFKDNGITHFSINGKEVFDIANNNVDTYIQYIGLLGTNGIKHLYFSHNDLWDLFKDCPEKFYEFIKTAGNSGIISLAPGFRIDKLANVLPDLRTNIFSYAKQNGINYLYYTNDLVFDLLNPKGKDLLIYLHNLGMCNYKILDFSDGNLNGLFKGNSDAFFETFFPTLRIHGFKYLELKNTSLNSLFGNDIKLLIKLIYLSGINGIKIFEFKEINLLGFFKSNPTSIIDFVTMGGKSGIKSLKISSNSLGNIFDRKIDFFIELILKAGQSGLINLNLQSVDLSGCINEGYDFLYFINKICNCGLKTLDLKFCNLYFLKHGNEKINIDIANLIENSKQKYGINILTKETG